MHITSRLQLLTALNAEVYNKHMDTFNGSKDAGSRMDVPFWS